MKKVLVCLLMSAFLLMLASCGEEKTADPATSKVPELTVATEQQEKQTEEETESRIEEATEPITEKSTEEITEKTTEEITEDPSKSEVTLEGENEYFIISDIDTSECEYENGYYSGKVYFNSHTTQKYIDVYGEYFYREITFSFYSEDGTLVADETTWENCVYNREYTHDSYTYVMFASKKPITEIKVSKIVLSK